METIERNLVHKLLKKEPEGLTLSDISRKTNLTKDRVRIAVAQLEGAELVKVQDVGKAKLIKINNQNE